MTLKDFETRHGVKKVSNYCLSSLYNVLVSLLSDEIKNPEDSPALLSEGIAYLLLKTNDIVNPKYYRPITCLSTTYRLLTFFNILANINYHGENVRIHGG